MELQRAQARNATWRGLMAACTLRARDLEFFLLGTAMTIQAGYLAPHGLAIFPEPGFRSSLCRNGLEQHFDGFLQVLGLGAPALREIWSASPTP